MSTSPDESPPASAATAPPAAAPETRPARVATPRGSNGSGDGSGDWAVRSGTAGTPPPRTSRGTDSGGRVFDWSSVGTDPTPPPIAAFTAAPAPAAETKPRLRKPKAAVVPRNERRFRQTIRRVDLWSVTKLSLCFYTSAMFVIVVALIALWVIADSAGVIKNVESFIGDLLSSKDFHFLSGEVLRGAVLVGLVIVALQVVITVIAASFYNIFAELFGGLEIVIEEEEQQPNY